MSGVSLGCFLKGFAQTHFLWGFPYECSRFFHDKGISNSRSNESRISTKNITNTSKYITAFVHCSTSSSRSSSSGGGGNNSSTIESIVCSQFSVGLANLSIGL